MFKTSRIKSDFPIFKHQPELVYLDSAASSLKPQSVINKEFEYYSQYCANIFRGIYKNSERATAEYEMVRNKVSKFIGCQNSNEIVFVRNATEAINLVMSTWGEQNIKRGDEIVISIMEHHANFVTWQELCKKKQAKLQIVDINQNGYLDENDLIKKVTNKTKLVALTHASNVLGTINPIAKLATKIKHKNPRVLLLVDGAQAVPHMHVNVSKLGCDFYAFSSHKMLGPTGVGILWGKYELLDKMIPYQFGGDMISAVYNDHTLYQKPPHKFEAGTPHIAGVIGLGAAIDYLEKIGMQNVRQHEQDLIKYAFEKLSKFKDLTIYGPKKVADHGGVMAFTVKNIHAHDIAQVLDSNNICVRSGHHCAMPLHIRLNLVSTARASFYIYTTKQDIDALAKGIEKVIKMFK